MAKLPLEGRDLVVTLDQDMTSRSRARVGKACSGERSTATGMAGGLLRAERLPPKSDRDRQDQTPTTAVNDCDELVRDVTGRMVRFDQQRRRRRRLFVVTGLLLALVIAGAIAWLFRDEGASLLKCLPLPWNLGH